jgi:hypothetical protein
MIRSKFRLVTNLTIVVMTMSVGISTLAFGDDYGHGRGGGHNFGGGHNYGGHGGGLSHGGGGQSFIDISPWGLSYGYQNRNFGIQVGPVGGQQHIHDVQPIYVQPSYPPVYNQYNSGNGNYSPAMSNSPPLNYAPPMNGTINTGNQPIPASNSNLKSVLINPGANPMFAENLVSNAGARSFYQQSLQSFSSGDYKSASRAALHSMLEDPQNGQLKLYISQCQLANGDFEAAVAHLFDALQRLEQDQWGGVVQNFRQFYKQNDYVPQIDRLVKFAQENPKAAYAFSLRGYHYYYLGHPDAAAAQWTKAFEIDPNEPLATKLKALTGGSTNPSEPTLAAPLPSSN